MKISQNSQENTWAGVSFSIMLQGEDTCARFSILIKLQPEKIRKIQKGTSLLEYSFLNCRLEAQNINIKSLIHWNFSITPLITKFKLSAPFTQ